MDDTQENIHFQKSLRVRKMEFVKWSRVCHNHIFFVTKVSWLDTKKNSGKNFNSVGIEFFSL